MASLNEQSKEVIFTKKEIFDIYGLFIGMMSHEANANLGITPAADWYYRWAEHPSLVKARNIYNEVREEKISHE